MLHDVIDLPGTTYGPDEYRAAFWEDIKHSIWFWKLECRQTFREPGSEKWEAFQRGDIAEALALEEYRESVATEYAMDSFVSHRVRMVKLPLTPYLWWEMHLLNVRAGVGERINVVVDNQSSFAELPELVCMSNAVWHITYDDSGVLIGGRRLADLTLAPVIRTELEALFDRGEPLSTFFAREVANHPAPLAQRS